MNYTNSGIAIALQFSRPGGRSLFRLYILSLVQSLPFVNRYDKINARNDNLRDS
ncbi:MULTISPECIES: hypothetical protein [unclassified Microcoleus]|uniref:hypothetical protein n=1 Tax=unclassified Microcoleus TaxID=2642155 RepID=UPI002FD40A47